MKKVCSINAILIFALMLIFPVTVLHAEDPPSTQDQAVREGQPASTAPVPPALRQALASSLGESVSVGAKAIPNPPTGSWGIVSEGDGGGGIFRDSDSEAEAWLGSAGYGVQGFGSVGGGYFKDSDSTGYARVGWGNYGIYAYGGTAGGYFSGSGNNGNAYVGHGSIGISAFGLDKGIDAYGTAMGGNFEDLDGTGVANVGVGNYGIKAYGAEAGGYFHDSDIHGGTAIVGSGDRGIEAYGTGMGGYFTDEDSSGFAYVGYGDKGIHAAGDEMGGSFLSLETSNYAYVSYDTYKIYGSGTVSFVQNHPYDPSSVIVYAAPEGDEVATYTRGTARLVDGEATVPLGETFKWVTNPDIGLTAHLTPRGEPIPLAVVELTTEEMIVRAPNDAPEGLVFDYIVYGLRIGFEESSIVQEKEQESYIPSMSDHRQLFERRSDLRKYNSLERFKGMRSAAGEKVELDLIRAHALRDAIIEFDPAVHELPKPPGFEEMPVDNLASQEAQRGAVQRVRPTRGDHDRRPATDQSDLRTTIPMEDEGNIYAASFRPPSREVVTLVDLSESVKPGDVLVIDRDTAGRMRRGFEGHDSGVVGVVLDSQPPALSGEEGGAETSLHAEVAIAGVVTCNVDATYGAIWPGNLLVTSPTSGHAMRTESPLPGTIVGKALEPLEEGVGTIKVLVMLR